MISSQAQSLPFVFFIILSFINRVTGVIVCPAQCQGSTPVVRFPFRLITQRVRCGYPGFDLLCTNMTKTAIQLPNSVQFVVDRIDYVTQTLIIKDRDSCLPRRFLDRSFNLAGTPFDKQAPVEFTFVNCSSSDQIPTASGLRTVDCLSGANFTVIAVPTFGYYKSVASTSTCSKISTVSVPVLWPVWSNLAEGVTLKWKVPDCRSCEDRGGYCGLKNYDSRHMELGCTNLRGSSGQPKIYSPWSAIDQPSTVSSSAAAATIPDCNSVISELNPCVGYMSKNQAKPSDTCCAGVKSLRQYNNNKAARQAICHCLESVAPMFGNIDYSLLAGLPKKCGVSVKLPADISPSFDCSKA